MRASGELLVLCGEVGWTFVQRRVNLLTGSAVKGIEICAVQVMDLQKRQVRYLSLRAHGKLVILNDLRARDAELLCCAVSCLMYLCTVYIIHDLQMQAQCTYRYHTCSYFNFFFLHLAFLSDLSIILRWWSAPSSYYHASYSPWSSYVETQPDP